MTSKPTPPALACHPRGGARAGDKLLWVAARLTKTTVDRVSWGPKAGLEPADWPNTD